MTIIRIGPDTPKYRTRISNEAKDCLRDYDTSKFEGRLAASPIVNEMSAPSRIGLALAASIMSGEASMPVATAPRRHSSRARSRFRVDLSRPIALGERREWKRTQGDWVQ